MLYREALGFILSEVRKEKSLTLRELAKRANISLGYLSELERGRKEPSSEILDSLTKALSISLGFLLSKVCDFLNNFEIQDYAPKI